MSRRALGPYGWSLGLHAAVAGLLMLGVGFTRHEYVEPLPIEAVVVDQSVIEALALERRLAGQRSREAAAQREADARLQREQLERQAEAEAAEQARRQAESELLAQRREQAEAEVVARRQAEKVAAERRAREQAEAQVAARRKAESEAQVAARRKAEAEARERAQREADLQARLAEEERRAAAVSSGAQAEYVARIRARIQRNWIRPASAKAGLRCVVRVTQIPGGEVVEASLGACNGDEAVKQSIISAVLRSSPLPVPADPSLFARNLNFEFVPED